MFRYSPLSANIYGVTVESDSEEVGDAELREVYFRYFIETMEGFKNQASFARATGIQPPEVTMVKKGDRNATQGHIIKIVRRQKGPELSEALDRLAALARDVEAEIRLARKQGLRVADADAELATLITAGGKKLALRPDMAAAMEEAVRDEAVKSISGGAKKRRRKTPSEHADGPKPSPPSAPGNRPSRDR